MAPTTDEIPPGRREELALERLACQLLEADANAAWHIGHYGLARELQAEARQARAHVDALEGGQA